MHKQLLSKVCGAQAVISFYFYKKSFYFFQSRTGAGNCGSHEVDFKVCPDQTGF
jgi:hypothetical protein